MEHNLSEELSKVSAVHGGSGIWTPEMFYVAMGGTFTVEEIKQTLEEDKSFRAFESKMMHLSFSDLEGVVYEHNNDGYVPSYSLVISAREKLGVQEEKYLYETVKQRLLDAGFKRHALGVQQAAKMHNIIPMEPDSNYITLSDPEKKIDSEVPFNSFSLIEEASSVENNPDDLRIVCRALVAMDRRHWKVGENIGMSPKKLRNHLEIPLDVESVEQILEDNDKLFELGKMYNGSATSYVATEKLMQLANAAFYSQEEREEFTSYEFFEYSRACDLATLRD